MTERMTKYRWFWVWDFEKEERWLNEMAANGWTLVEVGYCRYTFEKTDDNESSPASEDADKQLETSVNPNSESVNPEESADAEEQPAVVEQPAPSEEPAPTEEPVSSEVEAKPKKAAAKRTTKKASKKQ